MNNSIKQKLVLYYLLSSLVVLGIVLSAFVINYYQIVKKDAYKQLRDKSFVAGAWMDFNAPFDAQVTDYIASQESNINLALLDNEGELLAKNTAFPLFKVPKKALLKVQKEDDAVLLNIDSISAIVAVNNLYDGDKIKGFVLLTHATEEYEKPFFQMLRFVVLIGLIGIGVSVVVGYYFVRKMLYPIVEVTKAAENINAQRLKRQRLPIKNENDELGKLSIAINSLLNRLEKSFNDQKRFVDNAAHELRTPLTVLKGMIEVSQMKNNHHQEELENLMIEVDGLIELTNILLLMAKFDAESLKLRYSKIAFYEMIDDIFNQLASLAEKHKIKLVFKRESVVYLQGDRSLLYSLFRNLIENAIKYNKPNGKVMISFRQKEGYHQILIKDTGWGMEKEGSSVMFDRFQRGDHPNTRQISGIGLGLSLVKSIVKAHGGDVSYTTQENIGSEFVVVLPQK